MISEQEVALKVIRTLEGLKIPYMVVGSFAVFFWGRPRTTHDADLVAAIPPEAASDLASALQPEYFADDESIRNSIHKQSMFNVIHLDTGFKVDVWLLSDDAYRQTAFRRRMRVPLFAGSDAQVYITSAEDTILSKLLWYQESQSRRDFLDAVGVYEVHGPQLDEGYLDQWADRLSLNELFTQVRRESAQPPASSVN